MIQMQKLVAVFLVAMLASAVTVPMAFSDDGKNADNDDTQENDHDKLQFGFSNSTRTGDHENETKNNENSTKNDDKEHEKEGGKLQFGFSNSTRIKFTLPNGTTISFGFSNGTNVGQQISGFLHQIRDIFKQQESQEKQVIKDCRAKARENPANRTSIMNQCKANLKEIKQQIRSEHKQFQMNFKQFHNVVVGNNQEQHEKPWMTKSNGTSQNKTRAFQKWQGHEQTLKHDGKSGQGHRQHHEQD